MVPLNRVLVLYYHWDLSKLMMLMIIAVVIVTYMTADLLLCVGFSGFKHIT